MAKYEVPAHIEIAALKAKQVADVDLMAAGPGVPWEDRATHGPVGGFLKTAVLSLTSPRQMFQDLRRPNSIADSRLFVFVAGSMWSVGVLLHAAVLFARGLVQDPVTDLGPHAVLIVVAPFALAGLIAVANNVYTPMVAGELKKGTPPTLAKNVFGYSTGPSLLALFLVPIHWSAALVPVAWMAVVAVIGARTRMRLSVAGGTIAVVVSFVVAAALAAGVYFAGSWLYRLVTL